MSRSFSTAEKNYSTHNLKLISLKGAVVDKFKDYFYGAGFVVKTNNNPLTYILTTDKLDATGHRWLATLSGFCFSFKYRPRCLEMLMPCQEGLMALKLFWKIGLN